MHSCLICILTGSLCVFLTDTSIQKKSLLSATYVAKVFVSPELWQGTRPLTVQAMITSQRGRHSALSACTLRHSHPMSSSPLRKWNPLSWRSRRSPCSCQLQILNCLKRKASRWIQSWAPWTARPYYPIMDNPIIDNPIMDNPAKDSPNMDNLIMDNMRSYFRSDWIMNMTSSYLTLVANIH